MYKQSSQNDRGQVGIGTLIVFIALVLVAAIAAGVLINTAGFLQSQAEATGQESTDQVSNNIQVISSSAEVNSAGDIGVIELRVSLSPGADAIDLTQGTLTWVGDSDAATIGIDEDSNNDLSTYRSLDGSVTSAGDVDSHAIVPTSSGQDGQLTSDSERETILIVAQDSEAFGSSQTIGDITNDLPLTEGSTADVTLTTSSGGQTQIVLSAPDIMSSGEGVEL